MVVARWRCLRIWGIESSGLNREMRKTSESNPAEDAARTASPSTRAYAAIQSLAGGTLSEGLLRRYEAHYERQFTRAFNILVKFRVLSGTAFATRPAIVPESPPPPSPTLPPPQNLPQKPPRLDRQFKLQDDPCSVRSKDSSIIHLTNGEIGFTLKIRKSHFE